MKKVNLLFDATLLCNSIYKNSGRSGIFFTAYNIAKHLYNNKKINLSFYCQPDKISLLQRALNEELPEFADINILNMKECQTFDRSNLLDIFNSSSVQGLYTKESTGVWSSGLIKIKFNVNRCNLKSLAMSLKISKYFTSVSSISILTKSRTLIENFKQKNKNIIVDLPLNVVDDNGCVELYIKVNGASSPEKISKSDDQRVLGIMLDCIGIIINNQSIAKSFPFLSVNDKLTCLNSKLFQCKIRHRKIKKFLLNSAKSYYQLLKKITNFFANNDNLYSDIDAFLSPQFVAPKEIQQISDIKKYTIIYDTIPLLYPQYMNSFSIQWVKKLIKSMNKNDYYFAISDNTKNDFIRFAKSVDPNKFYTVPLAASDNFYVANKSQIKQTLKKYNIPQNKKYIFSLCTCDPRKNQIRAIKTFIEFIKKHKINDLVFVLGGGQWDHFIKQLEDSINDLGKYKNKIIRAGYIDDNDLAPLYSGAEWFVYTSQYEGFGLPPLEAMQCGCPVITSNNSSLPEVVGNAGIMIDWDSNEQHIRAYEKYYYDEKSRTNYSKKGLKRSQQFSWEKCAKSIAREIIKNA